MDYLQQAIDVSRTSFEAGAFPAGAVLVTKSGNEYKSDPSVAWCHGEGMAIDKAIKAEGYPLTDAVMYASMEPCLMCSAKMYWAGITKAFFVIPKSKVNPLYAYEDDVPMHEHIKDFHTPLQTGQNPALLQDALAPYNDWVKKIEAKHA